MRMTKPLSGDAVPSTLTKRQVKAQVEVKDDQGTSLLLPTSASASTSTLTFSYA